MAIVDLGALGSVTASSAGTTLVVPNSTGAIIPAGTLIHITGCWDNIASVTAPTITCSTIGGATATVNHATAIGSGVTTTAGSGVWHSCVRALTTADIASGGTIATVTSNQSAVKRAAHAEGWSGMTATLRGTVATGVSTAGTPSVATTGTALVTGDLVIGSASYENNALPTGDADTLNGTWDAVIGTFTTGGNAATNVGTASQDKTVTATGVQTYNPTNMAADSIACVYSLIPAVDPLVTQAAYRFYADGTESGSTQLGVAGVPIAYIANSSTTYASRTNTTITKPTGTLDGHLILIVLFTGLAGGSVTPTPPAGFTQTGTPANVTDGSFQGKLWLYWKIASGEGASWNWTHTAQTTQGAAFTYSGVDTTTPIDVAVAESTGVSQTNSWPSVITATDTALVIRVGHDWADGTTRGTPAGGYTNRLNSTILFLWDVAQATAGATGIVTAANANLTGTEPWASWTVALRPAVVGAAQSTASTVDVSSGDVNLQLRTRLQETAGGVVPAADDWQLQWSQGDGYLLFSGTTVALASDASTQVAQSFLGPGGPLTQATFWLLKSLSPTGTIAAALWAHDGGTFGGTGLPTGSPLATSTNSVTASTLTSTRTATAFTFDGTVTLTAGTPYFIGLVATGATTRSVGEVDVTRSSTPPTPAGLQANFTGTWAAAGGADLCFEVGGPWANVTSSAAEAFIDASATSDTSVGLTSAGAARGQAFLGNGTLLSRARFNMSRAATAPSGNVTAILTAHTGTYGSNGKGVEPVLATSTGKAASTLNTTTQLENFDFDSTVLLSSGTPYVIAATVDASDGTNFVSLRQNSISVHAGSASFRTGTTWTALASTIDVAFEVWGRPVVGTVVPYASPNLNTLVDSNTAAVTLSVSVYGNGTRGQAFHGNGETLSRAGFYLSKTGTPTGTITATLWAVTGTFGSQVGTGSPLATSTTVIDPTTLTGGTGGLVNFDFAPTVSLAVGTDYLIGVTANGGSDTNNAATLTSSGSGTILSNASTNVTGTWATYPADHRFEVYTAGGGPTTNRLTGGTGTFVAGKTSADGLADDVGWSASNYTELLYPLTLKQADLVNGNTLRFRVLRNGVTTSLTYTAVPTINVTKGAGPTPLLPPNIHVNNPATVRSFTW